MLRKLIQLAKRMLGAESGSQVEDPVQYNSKQDIDRRFADLKHFTRIMQRVQEPIEVFYSFMKQENLVQKGQSIIDVGCGSGNLVHLIHSDFPENSVTGADFSDIKLQNCRIHFPQIRFINYDIYEELDAKYDLIICTEVIEHLLYPGKALLNLVHGTTREGKVFITVPNGRTDTFSGHINFWSPESWKVFFEERLKGDYQVRTGILFSNKALYAIVSPFA